MKNITLAIDEDVLDRVRLSPPSCGPPSTRLVSRRVPRMDVRTAAAYGLMHKSKEALSRLMESMTDLVGSRILDTEFGTHDDDLSRSSRLQTCCRHVLPIGKRDERAKAKFDRDDANSMARLGHSSVVSVCRVAIPTIISYWEL